MASVIRIIMKAEGAAGIKGELDRAAGATEGFASRIRKGVAGAAVVAGAGLAAMAASGIAGARESAQIHRVLESQIRGMGAEAKKAFGGATTFAERYGTAIGKDDDDTLAVINKLSTFPAAFGKGSLGADAMRRATKAAFDLEASGIGAAQTNIVGIGKALDNPIKGMSALSKSGVSFTEEQKKQVAGYVKSGQLAKAQAVVLAGIETNAKGAAGAQADGLTKAKVALDNFVEGLATKALPYLDRFGNWFVAEGLPAIERFGTYFTTNIAPTIGSVFRTAQAAAGPFFAVISNPAVQVLAASILSVVVALKAYSVVMGIIRAVTVAATAVQIALNIAMLANPIGLVILVVIALVAAIVVAYKRSETFRNMVNAVGSALVAAGRKVVEFVTKAISFVKTLPGRIKAEFTRVKTLLLGVGGDLVAGFKKGISDKWNAFTGWVRDQINKIPLAVRKVLGIASPSKVMAKIGAQTWQGFELGSRRAAAAVRGKLKGHAETLAQKAIDVAKAKTVAWRQNIADLKKARDEYASTIAQGLRGGGITSLASLDGVSRTAAADTVVRAYRDRLAAIKDFRGGLDQLRSKGLGTGLLQQLVDGGLDSGGALVAGLRAATPSVLAQIRSLNAAVERESAGFGTAFAGSVFNGRITAAQKTPPPTVIEVRSAGGKLDDLLVELLRKSIRAKGGNVQVVLGAR